MRRIPCDMEAIMHAVSEYEPPHGPAVWSMVHWTDVGRNEHRGRMRVCEACRLEFQARTCNHLFRRLLSTEPVSSAELQGSSTSPTASSGPT